MKFINMIKSFFRDDVKIDGSPFANFEKESIEAVIEDFRDKIKSLEWNTSYHKEELEKAAIKLLLNKKALEILK